MQSVHKISSGEYSRRFPGAPFIGEETSGREGRGVSRMKKKILSIVLALGLLLVVVSPVLASYGYSTSITVTETSGSAKTLIPILLDFNNQNLVDYGYLDSDGLDTRMQEAEVNRPYSVINSKLGLMVLSISAYQAKELLYYTTYDPDAPDFDIITGTGGYVTVTDDAALELGDEFEMELRGYIDTSVGSNKNLVYKDGAYKLYVSAEGEITSSIYDGDWITTFATATEVTSGVRKVATAYDGADLTISVYDENNVLIDDGTDAFVGSIPSNDNDWILNQNSVMPYIEYIKFWTYPEAVEQVIFGGHYQVLSASGTVYSSLIGGSPWTSTELYNRKIVSTSGKITNLRVVLAGSPGAGKSYDFTLMLNGAPSALTLEIADAATSGSDTTNEVAVVAGDSISLRCVPTGTPAMVRAAWTSMFEGDLSKESLILGGPGVSTISNTATEYSQIMGANDDPTLTENDHRQVCPTPGIIKNLYVELSPDPGLAPDAYRFTLRKNGISQSLTVTITANDTTGNDTTHEVTVAAGDVLTMMVEPLETPSQTPYAYWGMTFVADISGESIILAGSMDDLSASTTEYNFLQASYDYAWTITEAEHYQLGQECTLKKFYVLLSGSPGAGKSYTFTLRKPGNGQADGNLTVTIADAATTGNDTVNEDAIANDNYVGLKCTPTGTPAGADAYWGLVSYIEPPTPELNLHFQPIAIISGTTLVDRAGTSQDGTITYGGRLTDSGSVMTLTDSQLTQADDYWNGYTLKIKETTDNEAPEGEETEILDFTLATLGGTADSGDTTFLVDTELTQTTAYWAGATLTIVTTTDGEAPQGEDETVTVWDLPTNTLTFAALTAAVDEGDTYTLTAANTLFFGSLTAVLGDGDRYEIWDGQTILWGSFLAGIKVAVGPLTAYTDPVSSAAGLEDPEVVSLPPEPGGIWGGDASSDLPMYDLFSSVAANLGWETSVLYVVAWFILSIGLGVALLVVTGSGLGAIAGVGAGMVGGMATGMLPVWVLLVYLVLAVTWLYTSRAM